MKLLVLRPQPGASATARRAAEAGLDAVIAPMFVARPLAWAPPDPGGFDALLMTSANAARHGGTGLARYRHLPVHAVGETTAAAARDAGFDQVTAGTGDAEALVALVAAGPHRRLLHLCGVHHRSGGNPVLQIKPVAVYATDAATLLDPRAEAACRAGAVALVHSPRAAALFGRLVDAAGVPRGGVSIVAISEAASGQAGAGWRGVVASPAPVDGSMLAIARGLCDKPGS